MAFCTLTTCYSNPYEVTGVESSTKSILKLCWDNQEVDFKSREEVLKSDWRPVSVKKTLAHELKSRKTLGRHLCSEEVCYWGNLISNTPKGPREIIAENTANYNFCVGKLKGYWACKRRNGLQDQCPSCEVCLKKCSPPNEQCGIKIRNHCKINCLQKKCSIRPK